MAELLKISPFTDKKRIKGVFLVIHVHLQSDFSYFDLFHKHL